MENNKKMFTGFSKVFNFTAAQNIKGKGFKLTTILLGVILAVAFALISIFMAVSQDGSEAEENDINNIINFEEAFDIDIYYINEATITDEQIKGIAMAEAFKDSTFIKVEEADKEKAEKSTNEYLEGKRDAIVMLIKEDEEKISIEYYLPYDTNVADDTPETLGEAFIQYIEFMKTNEIVTLNEKQLELYNASVYSQAIEAGSEPEELGVMLARMLVPMLFALVLYMMILLYGQNITKIVVSEKSSKLMETLLTSVKPYAIISGKILAVSSIAIVQMLIWIFAAVGGYVAGEKIAESINPGYTNYISLIIDMISESSDAFSLGAIIIAVLMIIVGFLMFSVLAGLVAATVDKMEDISSAMSLFQVPVILGFMGAYFVPLMENDILSKVVTYLPLTSPFCVPAEVMVGNITIIESLISLAIVIAVTFGLILLTGKIYKGKLFNRH